jgi:NADP-dependent aldehyde dehydrogenase
LELTGQNLLAGTAATTGDRKFTTKHRLTGEALSPEFTEATSADVDRAVEAAAAAFDDYSRRSPEERAAFLDRIADEIVALGDELIQRANAESALPEARLTGERARTVGQLKMFAGLIREGSWVEAHIDRALPDR